MDINNCRSTRLIKNRRDGKFYLKVKNRQVPSVVLPNVRLTNVRLLSTHLYNLDAPEQSESTQPDTQLADEMDEIQQEDLTQVPSDPTTPSSSRRCRRHVSNDYIYDAIMQQNQHMRDMETQQNQPMQAMQIQQAAMMQLLQ